MDKELQATAGVGLRGMRERLRELGGTLEIGSGTGSKGTTILVQLPVGEDSVNPPPDQSEHIVV